MLNEKEIFDWKYRGYLVNNILSQNDVDEINNELNNLRIQRNKKDSSWGEYGIYSHPHKESELILKYFGYPKLIEILETILNDKIEGIQSQAYFKPPGELGRDAHQDGFYTESGWGNSINVIFCLDDSDQSNGCLWSYESSHFLPILPIEIDEERIKTNPTFWKNERGKGCVMPQNHNFKKIYHECKSGDILFTHDYLVHGSEDNNSENYRRSIVMSYKTIGSNLRQGGQMKREPFDVYEIRKKYWNL
jgi:ectoine hydroxylase-related dioxygenase (phytanoyl-CoA dioxygenase family)